MRVCGSGDVRRRRVPYRSGKAVYWRAAFPPGRVTTSAAARWHRAHRGPRRGTNSCRYRCRSRRSLRGVSETWRAPCLERPLPASRAGKAGARPDHPINGRSRIRLDVQIILAHQSLMHKKASDLGGIIAMLAATAAFVVGDSFMKIVIEDLPPFEVLFLRGIAASFACAVLVALRAEWGALFGLLDVRALLRAAGETLCTFCYVVALARMPIADVIAILQTGPLILILGAAFLLRERIEP